MIDDLKYIHQRDSQDALGIAQKQSQQLLYDYAVADFEADIDNVVLAGMGGSALGALLTTTWPNHKVPFVICRDYDIPPFVGPRTLFIASSYSGNTEETLSALEQAESSGAVIAVISAGGKLGERAKQKEYPLAALPAGMQPRYAALYNFKAVISILQASGAYSKSIDDELSVAAAHIKAAMDDWRPDIASSKNRAKQIALDLIGKSPVIYASPAMFPAAYKWKISINENAKNVAWCNQIPEFNHNEFIGWSSHPIEKPYAVVDLRSSYDHERIQKRFDVSARMLSGKRPMPITIEAVGDSPLQHLLWLVALGDFVSLYMALLNGIDPTPVELIEKFKTTLG